MAIEVKSRALLDLRKRLASEWAHWLEAQDKGGFRPHVTIQNKVRAAEALRTLEIIASQWQPLAGKADGLQLWRYRGGPWESAREFLFGKNETAVD